MTARWVVDEVRPARDLNITWQPISLFVKNEADPDSDMGKVVFRTHRMLRVLESVRSTGTNDDVERLYWEFGRRIHHDKEMEFPIEDALSAVGLDESHAAAYDDGSWDDVIQTAMGKGLELAGTDIGTPIIALRDDQGEEKAYFGPVITRVPPTDKALAMWDALVTMMNVDGFWELKRTRTERPDFGERP